MQKSQKNLWIVVSVLTFVLFIFVILNILVEKRDGYLPEYLDDYELPSEVTGFDLDNQPVKTTNESATIDMVFFGDYKCPYCKMWYEEVFPIINEHYIETGLINFYSLNFQSPAVNQRDAILAGIGGEIIYEMNPDSYWEYKRLVYKNQKGQAETWATESFLTNLVKENLPEIDVKNFKEKLKEEKYLIEVQKDLLIGLNHGVRGTPSVFINGKKVNIDLESILNELERLLNEENRMDDGK